MNEIDPAINGGLTIKFSDVVSAFALIVSIVALWITLSSVNIEKKRLLGETEIILDSINDNGRVRLGEASNSFAITGISIHLPNEVEPLISYEVKKGGEWLNEKALVHIRCYFVRRTDEALKRFVSGRTPEALDFANKIDLDFSIPVELPIGVHVTSRSMGETHKSFSNYNADFTYRIQRPAGTIFHFRDGIKSQPCDQVSDEIKIEHVSFRRAIDLNQKYMALAELLTSEMTIPFDNNHRAIYFYLNNNIFPFKRAAK